MSEVLPLGENPAGNYGQERRAPRPELPRPLARVIDVGCDDGGATEIVGVELQSEAAAKAAEVYDRVDLGDDEALMRLSEFEACVPLGG